MAMDDLEGIDRYHGRMPLSLMDWLAEAWLVIHSPTDPKGNRDLTEIDGYVGEEWTKMVNRVLRGWAECHERPITWPWTDRDFDRFWNA